MHGPRLVDVHERQSADRADPDPLGRDVGDARRHDDLDVALLELPGDPAQLAGRVEGAAGDEDDVGVGDLDREQELVGRAEHGYAGAGSRTVMLADGTSAPTTS